jgi:hypothetical protein
VSASRDHSAQREAKRDPIAVLPPPTDRNGANRGMQIAAPGIAMPTHVPAGFISADAACAEYSIGRGALLKAAALGNVAQIVDRYGVTRFRAADVAALRTSFEVVRDATRTKRRAVAIDRHAEDFARWSAECDAARAARESTTTTERGTHHDHHQ